MTIEELVERIDALTARVEELESNIAEMEGNIESIAGDFVDSAVSDALWWVEEAEEFADLDVDCSYTDENILILHTDRFRTASLARACNPSGGGTYRMTGMPERLLTPDILKQNISRAQKGEYVLLESKVFSYSDEFEQIIMDAIAEGKVYFAFVTNDPQTIPQQILGHLRVVQ